MPDGRRIVQIVILLGTAVILFVYSRRKRQAEAEKVRREKIKQDYPELISRLLLLLQAGLVSRSAFIRIANDYTKDLSQGKKKRPAFDEVCQMCQEMTKGVSEEDAYMRFSARCVLPNYRTLSVLLVQNLKKGGTGLSDALEREIVTAQEEKKRTARIEGEKASVKLLLPMGMMLMVVLAVMVIPAFMSV